MKMTYNVYLSGPIDPKHLHVCKEWRRITPLHLPDHVHCINPMRGDIHPVEGMDLDSIPVPPKELVARDLQDISRADLMLVFWPGISDKQGIGTLMEIAVAMSQEIPILVVDPSGKISDHPWIQHAATSTYTSLLKAWEAINTFWSVE